MTTSHPAVDADARRRRFCVEGSADDLGPLLAEDLCHIHSSGLLDTKQSFVDRIRSGDLDYKTIDVESSTVRDYGNVTCISGVMLIDVLSSGTVKTFRCRFIEEWQGGPEGWQLRYWQSTFLAAA